MKVKVEVAQSCLTLCNPVDYTVHGILQARILEWVAFPFSGGSSQPRDRTQVSRIAGRFFTSWATGEACINTINYCEKDTLCLTETFKWNYYCSGEDQRISSEKKCLTECTGWLLCVTTNFKSCQARLFGVCPSKFQILVLFKWLVSKSRDTSQWEPSIWMTHRCITSDFFNN